MIKGFSRLSQKEKIDYLVLKKLGNKMPDELRATPRQWGKLQKILDGLSENVISCFPFPYSIAPNFMINEKLYIVPMVTEESSVVAAAAKSALFWCSRGGFKTQVLGTVKHGQVHFKYKGDKLYLTTLFEKWVPILKDVASPIDAKMRQRGGGIQNIVLLDKTNLHPNYFQIDVGFKTCDAMGANYMNSCLEEIASGFSRLVDNDAKMDQRDLNIIMSILSNYSPGNAVHVKVSCPVNQLDDGKLNVHPIDFARKFCEAVEIANVDTHRAVTHNKGIFNGVDSVLLATGNDWRAVEANGHAYAAESGTYKSLSKARIVDKTFIFEATLPMQVGTVGGILSVHPMVKLSLDILGNPGAEDLMAIVASVGLASNYAAVRSLITTGIQRGHMKMHLSNILSGLKATEEERMLAKEYFSNQNISYSKVQAFIEKQRTSHRN